MATGECNCGGVAFEVDAEINQVVACHCSICRKATGSSHIPVVLVEKSAFRWLRGEDLISTWKKPGSHWQFWFCKTCGSPLPGINGETQMFIPAGCITEGGDTLEITDHIWVNSKAHWEKIGDDGVRHPEGYRSASD